MNQHIKDSFRNDTKIPKFLSFLFWEYDPREIYIHKHAELIMGRIMERGSWASMLWLQETYSKYQLTSFLETKGSRTLPARELNYWAFLIGIPTSKRQKWLKEAKEKPHVWRSRFSR